jgi:farnesyl diphosphate synthase
VWHLRLFNKQRRQAQLTDPDMAFEAKLTEIAAAVEIKLTDILTDSTVPDRMTQAIRLAVLGGGKRVRPFLVVESARLFGISQDQAMSTAAALECVHCYSLVHDDLPAMDNDLLRRGQPTVWKAFDEWTAILAGDGLLTLAFEILGRPETHASAEIRIKLVQELARASGPAGMAGGQCLDLEAEKLGQPVAPTLAHIRRLQAMKTGALIRFGTEAGAILGQATTTQQAALRSYGDHLGFAFQIADDLLDAAGDAATIGKAIGKDVGKATLVSLMRLAAARAKLAETEAAAIAALAPFGRAADTLREAARFVASRKK